MAKYVEAREKNNKKWKNEFSDKLRALLKEKKMTQRELAIKTKIVNADISNYVNGRRIPDVRHAIKIALALEIQPYQFFEELFGFMDYVAWPSYLD